MKDSIKEVNSIFEQPWWLDAVAPNSWDCVIVKEGDEIVGRLPYVKKKRLGFRLNGMPQCTQTLGPWVCCNLTNKVKALAKTKEIYEHLLAQIPQGWSVDLVLDHSVSFFLPFIWHGYKVEPTVSYRFSDLSDLDAIFKGIKDTRKRIIRNAAKYLEISDSNNVDTLIALQKMTFKRQNRKSPIPDSLIRNIDNACLEHEARKILVAQDCQGNVHAVAYLVYDDNRCYYLMGGANPDYRQSGAQSLLLWEGIKFASTVSRVFDFEGSNIEDIEKVFRSYGSDYVINYRISKLNPVLAAFDYFKPKIKRLIGYKL